MENSELLKRAEDLRARCEKSSCLTHSLFLTPAEGYELSNWAKYRADCRLLLFGGQADCERTVAFFLPYYMDEESFDAGEYISVIRIKAHFGEPTHRDYMGALLAMGIGREWLGDIRIDGQVAHVLCLPSVQRYLLDNLSHVGRCGVKAETIALAEIPMLQRVTKAVQFTVQSLRLDAIVGGLFSLSRGAANAQIQAGNVSLNYLPCLKPDAAVAPGDILSLRGHGKGSILDLGGTTRKGRQFVQGEIWK